LLVLGVGFLNRRLVFWGKLPDWFEIGAFRYGTSFSQRPKIAKYCIFASCLRKGGREKGEQGKNVKKDLQTVLRIPQEVHGAYQAIRSKLKENSRRIRLVSSRSLGG